MFNQSSVEHIPSALHALRQLVVRQYLIYIYYVARCSDDVERPDRACAAESTHGVVDRRGRYTNTKPTICSSRGQCRSISSKATPVWSALQLTQVPKTPDQAVFVLTTTTTDGQTNYLTCPFLRMRARGNNRQGSTTYCTLCICSSVDELIQPIMNKEVHMHLIRNKVNFGCA